MGLLKIKKNKRYSYTPRFYKGEGSPFEIKHKLDEYRTTVGSNSGFKSKLNNAINDYKYNANSVTNKRVLIIAAVLLLLFLILIDFDLSIFFAKN
jgi:hypothetical protein